jgi:hypothetical protein
LNSCPNGTYAHSIVGRAFEQFGARSIPQESISPSLWMRLPKKPFLGINLSTSRQRNVPKFCKITAAFSAHGTAFIPSTIKISDFQDVKLHTAAGVRP